MMNVPPVTDSFESLTTEEYMKWVERAEILLSHGFETDLTLVELAEKLFLKSKEV